MTDIEHEFGGAVRMGDAPALIRLLASLPSGWSPRTLVRGGVRALFSCDQGARWSLARVCVESNDVTLLQCLLAESALGLSMQDLCTQRDATDPRKWHYASLAKLATVASFPAGLRLALECEAGHPDLSLEQFGKWSNRTLHSFSLDKAFALTNLEDCKNAAICAQLLLAYGAPLSTFSNDTHGSTSRLSDTFFSKPWPEDIRPLLSEMASIYFAAGVLDLDGPLSKYAGKVAGASPLGAALANACPGASRALIELGCDLQQVTEAFPQCDGDLLSMARAYPHSAAVLQPFVAELAAALMERQIRAQALPCMPSPVPNVRRCQRSGL